MTGRTICDRLIPLCVEPRRIARRKKYAECRAIYNRLFDCRRKAAAPGPIACASLRRSGACARTVREERRRNDRGTELRRAGQALFSSARMPAERLFHPGPSPDEAGCVVISAAPGELRVKALRRFALSITILTVLGHLFLGFEQAPVTPVLTLLLGYVLDLALETFQARVEGRPVGFLGGFQPLVDYLLPTHIGALACAMLLYGNSSPWPYLFAIATAVASRHILRIRVDGRPRHVLNPSNAGIALTLVLFPWVSIAPPYHFTAGISGALDWLLPLGVLMAGTLLNGRLTGKMPLIVGWLAGFVGQALLRSVLFDHNFVAALLPMTGLAFILFTNYMITDPGTTPRARGNQVWFGLCTAAVYGLLVLAHVSYGLFLALVITCILRAGLLLVGRHRLIRARRIRLRKAAA